MKKDTSDEEDCAVVLVRRRGYQNVPKGLRRLEQLCRGEFRGTTGLLRAT